MPLQKRSQECEIINTLSSEYFLASSRGNRIRSGRSRQSALKPSSQIVDKGILAILLDKARDFSNFVWFQDIIFL